MQSNIKKYPHDALVSRGKVKTWGHSFVPCAECESSGVYKFLLELTISNNIWQNYVNIFLPRAHGFRVGMVARSRK